MKTQWVLAILTVWTLGFGVTAKAQSLRQTESQAIDILKDLNSRRAKNPIFRCYHLGRLKGVSDRLYGQISRSSRERSVIQKAEKLFAKINQPIETWGYDCDPTMNMRAPIAGDLATEVSRSVRRIRGVSAEDPVISCFLAGRLKILSLSYGSALRRKIQMGHQLTNREEALYNTSKKVARIKSSDCDRF